MLKLFTYLFIKNKLLTILFGLSFIAIHVINVLSIIFHRHGGGEAPFFLFQSLVLANFMFIIFVFLAYEYFYAVKKSNLIEVLKSTKFGVLKLYSFQFLVMLLLNIIITLSFGVYNIGSYFYHGFEQLDFLVHLLLHLFLNLFLMLIVATLVGWVLALIFKRLISYLGAILFLFLGSRIFEEMALGVLFSSEVNLLYQIHDIFNLSDPALTWSANFHFAYSVLPDRFGLMLAWISILLGVVLFKLIDKRKVRNSLTIVSLLMFLIAFHFYQQPGSRFVMSHTPEGSLMYDFFHYMGQEIETMEADFNVLTYDLEMVVRNQLFVTATLTMDEQLPVYRFTLYHRYLITSVTDQNEVAMDFVQEGDHFRVYNDQEVLEALIIHYVGYSPRFYSNRQGMILPGFFPYFPHAGHHLVYDYQWGVFEPIMLPQAAYFNVRVTGTGHVFSNLEEIGANHFAGRTSSVTLISGFLNRQVVDGITVVYPFLDHMEFNYESNVILIRDFIDNFSGSDDIETILILPNLNLHHMATVIHSDHMTARGIFWLAEMAYESLINPRKRMLYSLLDLYLNDREWFYGEVAWELSIDMAEHHRYAVMIQERIKEMGLELVLELATSYIEDDTDRRSISEFLLDLEQESDHVRN